MAKESEKIGEIVSACIGMYARIARKLNVSPSMVSRVANGTRSSTAIEAALRDELEHLMGELDSYFG